jgi:hypothetical protein
MAELEPPGGNIAGSAGDGDATGVPSRVETVDTTARIRRKGKRTNITAMGRGRQRPESKTIGLTSKVCQAKLPEGCRGAESE